MPNPDDEPELPGKPRRRPSHFRKKRRDTTTKVVRSIRDPVSTANDSRHVVRSNRARQEQWSEVINPAPTLPAPLLERPPPPPAPLPAESSQHELLVPSWLDDRHRRKRVEDLIGTIGLALMVAAMLAAMWLRMVGP